VTGSAERLYEELAAEELQRPGVSVGRALRNEVLKVNDKIFAFVNGGRLVVKLPADRVAAMVGAGDGEPFESGGRRMKEWVAVHPSSDPALWRGLMADAREFVAGLAGEVGSAGRAGRRRR
jgi:hypothetical protein